MAGLAPSALELLADQLARLEKRAGRVAVRVSIAVPLGVDVSRARSALSRMLGIGRAVAPDLELIGTLDSSPRLLTVDFDMPEEP